MTEETSMRAVLSKAAGGPDSLVVEEVMDPTPKAGEVVIEVKAIGINYPDTLIIEDRYQFKPERPFSPGAEVAGVVDAVGEGVKGVFKGDRVIAVPGWGGLVERLAVPASSLIPMPEGMSFEEAAALTMTYGTSYYALKDRAKLQPGETLLVLSGGLKLATGRDGADVVYDAVGGDYAEPALRAMDWNGRYLVVGFPAGIPSLPLNLTLLKSVSVIGVFWGAAVARDPKAHAANMAELMQLWTDGKIKPRVSRTYPLAEAHEAIKALGDRQAMGKIVVVTEG